MFPCQKRNHLETNRQAGREIEREREREREREKNKRIISIMFAWEEVQACDTTWFRSGAMRQTKWEKVKRIQKRIYTRCKGVMIEEPG